MGSSKYHIQRIINFLLTRGDDDTYIKIKDIANIIGLSERTIQRYVSDLEKLNIVARPSKGNISLNKDYLRIVKDLGFNYKQLTLDDFLLVKVYADPILSMQDHINDILRKVKFPLRVLPTLRNKLLHSSLENLKFKGIYGEKPLYPNFVRDSNITANVVGIAAKPKKVLFRIQNYYCFYIAYAASALWYVRIKNGEQESTNDNFMVKPDFHRIKDEDLPLRELFTEFPSLRRVSYKLVCHYLAQTLLYQLAAEALTKYGEEIEYFFRLGSLIPHGFYSIYFEKDASFRKLKHEFSETFNNFLRLAKNYGTKVCGVVIKPRDNWFSKYVISPLISETNEISLRDNFALSLIMEEKDATCLCQRKEKGKGVNNYEFYMKNKHVVSKYEFLTLKDEDPIHLQREIAEIAYNTCDPYPFRFTPNRAQFDMPFNNTPIMAPFVCQEASFSADVHVRKLEKLAKIAFEYGIEKMEELWSE